MTGFYLHFFHLSFISRWLGALTTFVGLFCAPELKTHLSGWQKRTVARPYNCFCPAGPDAALLPSYALSCLDFRSCLLHLGIALHPPLPDLGPMVGHSRAGCLLPWLFLRFSTCPEPKWAHQAHSYTGDILTNTASVSPAAHISPIPQHPGLRKEKERNGPIPTCNQSINPLVWGEW